MSIISNTSYLHRNNLTGYEGTIYNLSFYNTYLKTKNPYYPLLLPTGINPLLPFYESPSRITNDQRNFTQEIRAQSSNPDARVAWVGGFFYAHNRQLSSEQIEDPLVDDLFIPVFHKTIEDDVHFGGRFTTASTATSTRPMRSISRKRCSATPRCASSMA